MRKILKQLTVLLLIALVTPIASPTPAMAQTKNVQIKEKDIKGTWVADCRSMMDQQTQYRKSELSFTFASGRMTIELDIVGNAKQGPIDIEVGIRATSKSNCKLQGKTLNISSSGKKPSIDFYRCHIDADKETRTALARKGVTDESVMKIMKQHINTDDYAQILRNFHGEMTFLQYSPTQLIIGDDYGTKITFTKKR